MVVERLLVIITFWWTQREPDFLCSVLGHFLVASKTGEADDKPNRRAPNDHIIPPNGRLN